MTNETTILLKDTYQLLKKSERWSQGAFAHSNKGRPVGALSPSAHSYCLIGALRRSDVKQPNGPYKDAVKLLSAEALKIDPKMKEYNAYELSEKALTGFNDRAKHRHIKKILRRAIRKSKKGWWK